MLAIGLVGCSEWASAPPVGFVVVGKSVHDCGVRRKDEKVFHTFVLKNVGRTELTVFDVISSCGCMAYRPPGGSRVIPVAPGKTFDVPLTFEIRPPQGATVGEVVVSYRLDKNDQSHKSLTLKIRADVMSDYQLSRQHLDFGDIDADSPSPATAEIDFIPDPKSDVRILGVSTSHDWLKAAFQPGDDNSKRTTIQVSLDPTHSKIGDQAIHGHVTIETTSQTRAKEIIRIEAKIIPSVSVSVSPTAIIVDSSESGVVKHIVRIVGKKDFSIIGVDANSPKLHLKTISSTARIAEIHCEIPPGEIDSAITVSVSLAAGHGAPLQRLFHVPVYRFHERGLKMTRANLIAVIGVGVLVANLGLDAVLGACFEPSSSTRFCATTILQPCASYGTEVDNRICNRAYYAEREQFPIIAAPATTGATMESSEKCWRRCQCAWNGDERVCVSTADCRTWQYAGKIVNNLAITCPPAG